MKIVKILLVLLCTSVVTKAQLVSNNNRRVADVYFINKEYYAAAEYYKRALQISSDTLGFLVPYGFENKVRTVKETSKREDYEYAVFQLATSLRLYKNFQDAEKWYAISNTFTSQKYTLSEFWYGVCLHANLKYNEAIGALNSFNRKYAVNDEYKTKAKLELESCNYALAEMQYPRLVKVAKLQNNINQAGSNYAPFISNQTFYFTSSRPVLTEGKDEVLTGGQNAGKVARKQNPYINTLYSINNNNAVNSTVSIKKVNVDVKKMESAAMFIHPNGNIMFLTAWLNKDERLKSIYISRRNGEEWSEPVALGAEINVPGYNAIQPFVSKDGKQFIFASDRPGGFGKYDLWAAPLRPDGGMGTPVNMGNKINTSEDEQAPYYNAKTNKLIYSSNGKVGLGGYDFFEAEGDFNNWSMPVNMGYPFNSAKDDMYFTPLDDMDREGYISSDRESLCCLEVLHVKRQLFTVTGKLIDCVTNQPLEGAKVTLTDFQGNKNTLLTDKNGSYNFQMNSNRGVQINAVKDSYFAKNIAYNYEQLVKLDTMLSADLCLEPIIIDKPIVLENIFYEFAKADLTEASKLTLNNLYTIMIDNPDIEIELSAHTDIIGSEVYNLDLSDRRARSCVDYLVSKGIAETRMTWKGYGFSQPIAPNKLADGTDNPEGRALNRRTEFKVTKK